MVNKMHAYRTHITPHQRTLSVLSDIHQRKYNIKPCMENSVNRLWVICAVIKMSWTTVTKNAQWNGKSLSFYLFLPFDSLGFIHEMLASNSNTKRKEYSQKNKINKSRMAFVQVLMKLQSILLGMGCCGF